MDNHLKKSLVCSINLIEMDRSLLKAQEFDECFKNTHFSGTTPQNTCDLSS